jgi:hypothetical protein
MIAYEEFSKITSVTTTFCYYLFRCELNEIYNSIKKTSSPLVLRDLESEYEKKLEDIALAKKRTLCP